MSEFIFATCQIGAEGTLKREIARRWPALRFAFSRPGFLTFKLPPEHHLRDDFSLRSVFARAYGFSLGKVSGPSPKDMAVAVWKLVENRPIQKIHVWPKDAQAPGDRGYEPALTEESRRVHRLLVETCPHSEFQRDVGATQPGESVLDCILLSPEEWWIGYHRAKSVASLHPGGMMPLELPPDAVSRAWLKMEEALRWSRLPIPPGARVAEIGSAPGGSSQALLGRGFRVTGIDPAEMDPIVLNHPYFTHVRRRSSQVRRREFQKIRWLTADMNVAPKYTLDAVEAIVAHPRVNIRGLLLTLKLTDWKLADELPNFLDRIRSWGFNRVKARQLQHNRREVCAAALQKPFRRKPPLTGRR
ncbi:MAG: hypothetical protein JW959_07620 [Pirellulales bacterium]|nr:hypothetical protein [Pirellulales bacterium]